MAKEKKFKFNFGFFCFLITLGLTLLFINFAIKNPGLPSIKFYILSVFFGFITFMIILSFVLSVVDSVIEKKVLENGTLAKAKILSARFLFFDNELLDVSYEREEYNNKPFVGSGSYQFKILFTNEEGKEIKKSVWLDVNASQLSYLVEKGNINIIVYKNNFAFNQEMLDSELAEMPTTQKLLKLENNKIKIKASSLYFSKSKKMQNAYVMNVDEYCLYVSKCRRHSKDINLMGGPEYCCSIEYKVNLGEQKKTFWHTCYREGDFPRIQANQKEGLPLPILVKGNKAYIDFNKLPLV